MFSILCVYTARIVKKAACSKRFKFHLHLNPSLKISLFLTFCVVRNDFFNKILIYKVFATHDDGFCDIRSLSKFFKTLFGRQTHVLEHFPKLTEDFRRRFEDEWIMYTNKFKWSLRDKKVIKNFILVSGISFSSILLPFHIPLTFT